MPKAFPAVNFYPSVCNPSSGKQMRLSNRYFPSLFYPKPLQTFEERRKISIKNILYFAVIKIASNRLLSVPFCNIRICFFIWVIIIAPQHYKYGIIDPKGVFAAIAAVSRDYVYCSLVSHIYQSYFVVRGCFVKYNKVKWRA